MPRKPSHYLAVYAIFIRDGKALLLRRANSGFEDGNYSLVAGHTEPGESNNQALEREVLEESGVQVSSADYECAHIMHRYAADREYIDVYYTIKRWDGKITNMEPEKCDDLSWFNLDDLPVNIIDYIRQALECVAKNEYYSEYGW